MLGGVPVYQSSLVNVAAATTGDYNCVVFHKDAFGLAMMQDVKIETQRQAAARAFDIVGSAIYGQGILYNNAGVYAQFDSTIE